MNKNNNINNIVYDIKRKPLNGRKNIIVMILAIIFFIYCIYLLCRIILNPTDTFIVEYGKIYKEENQLGYIIRDEQIIEDKNLSNNIVQLKTEGKKVASGEPIYRYSLENEDEINQKIEDLDIQIQEALKKENTLFSPDIKLLEAQIESQLENIYESTSIKDIEQNRKKISNLINKKAKVAGELTPSNSYIKNLIEEKAGYENQLNGTSEYIYSPRSGIISYKIDDLENVLKIGDFSYLNKDFLNSLDLKTSQIIATSNEKAKIIDNFKCYITFVSSTQEAKESIVGDKIKIRLPNAKEISAKIVYKLAENDKEDLIVLELEQCVEDLINYRKISFDIIWWSDSGMKVPNLAINYEDKFAYILRNRAGYEEKIFVKVLRKNEQYAIVDNYSISELEQEGYDISNITNKNIISLCDEIIIKND